MNQLKKDTAVRSFLGVSISIIQNKLNDFNIDKCKTIMKHAGGIDDDQGVDLDTLGDNYSTLLYNLTSTDRPIIVSGLLPRHFVDLGPYNRRLKTLRVKTRTLNFVDDYNGF